ncbi:MAG: orotate phosphoribosyltransferase [Deltaproteobacteria bacterium]|nr:orotate phosphoribosyltransferase [Deltaproteobacteria bacterium]
MDVRKQRLIELLLTQAFAYRVDPPFQLSSGATSPYYIDCKPVILSAEGQTLVGALGYEIARDLGAQAIGGLTLGADPIACAIAHHSFARSTPLAAFVVRKEAKGHGTTRWIEGALPAGCRVAVLDDVLTTGKSTLLAVDRVRQAGFEVTGAIVLVDREEGGSEALRAAGVEVHPIATRTQLMALRASAERHRAEAA